MVHTTSSSSACWNHTRMTCQMQLINMLWWHNGYAWASYWCFRMKFSVLITRHRFSDEIFRKPSKAFAMMIISKSWLIQSKHSGECKLIQNADLICGQHCQGLTMSAPCVSCWLNTHPSSHAESETVPADLESVSDLYPYVGGSS